MAIAQEFTSDLSQDYLASLLNPIEEQGISNIGRARAEGAAGGLGMQAATGSRIASEERSGDIAKNSAISGFNLDVARQKSGERQTSERQAFQDAESQKARDFQEHMTQMGYAEAEKTRSSERRANKIAGEQGMIESAGLSLATKGIGSAFGGLTGGGGGGGVTGNFLDSFSADSVGEGANDLNGQPWGF